MDNCTKCVFTTHNPELNIIWSQDYGLAAKKEQFCCQDAKDIWIRLAKREGWRWAHWPESVHFKEAQSVS